VYVIGIYCRTGGGGVCTRVRGALVAVKVADVMPTDPPVAVPDPPEKSKTIDFPPDTHSSHQDCATPQGGKHSMLHSLMADACCKRSHGALWRGWGKSSPRLPSPHRWPKRSSPSTTVREPKLWGPVSAIGQGYPPNRNCLHRRSPSEMSGEAEGWGKGGYQDLGMGPRLQPP